MDEQTDLVIGEQRISRSSQMGFLMEFRAHMGMEIALYVPANPSHGSAHWRVVIPDNPVLLSLTTIYDPVSGKRKRCLSKWYPPMPRLGGKSYRTTALAEATAAAEKCRFTHARPLPKFLQVEVCTHWQDGTTLKFLHCSGRRYTRYEGKRVNIPNTAPQSLINDLREAAGLAPTPMKYLQDGLTDEDEARHNYLRQVAEDPKRQHTALHILGNCEM